MTGFKRRSGSKWLAQSYCWGVKFNKGTLWIKDSLTLMSHVGKTPYKENISMKDCSLIELSTLCPTTGDTGHPRFIRVLQSLPNHIFPQQKSVTVFVQLQTRVKSAASVKCKLYAYCFKDLRQTSGAKKTLQRLWLLCLIHISSHDLTCDKSRLFRGVSWLYYPLVCD